MTSTQTKKLDALHAALSLKKPDRSPVIDGDTHREWIEYMVEGLVRFPGATMGTKDLERLDVLHQHYLGA